MSARCLLGPDRFAVRLRGLGYLFMTVVTVKNVLTVLFRRVVKAEFGCLSVS